MSISGSDRPIVMIGCGNMAGAILDRWLASGLRPDLVTVVDPGKEMVAAGVTLVKALPAALPDNATIILGVKPQLLPDVAPLLGPLLDEGNIVISMLAGVTVATLRASLGQAARYVRIMPNTPVALGKGVCVLFADGEGADEACAFAADLLQPLGLVERIDDEAQFNLVTALTGCGPAFVFRYVDALASAAAALGLDDAQALRLAIATVEGSSALAASSDDAPGVLADRVASKGGMTREGLDVMDADDRLNRLIADTLRAAQTRGVELEKLAR